MENARWKWCGGIPGFLRVWAPQDRGFGGDVAVCYWDGLHRSCVSEIRL